MVSGARAFSLTAAVAIAMIAGAAAAPAAAKVALTVDAQKAAITHKLRPLDMGCHSDTGYSHQPMGLHAQRIYGPSFEAPAPVHAATDGTGWVDVSSGAGVGGATLDATTAFHGFSSEKLSFRGGGGGGGGRAAVANRGLGNEGLFFEAGKDYEGYFWAKASKPAKLTIAIEAWSPDGGPPKVLASTTVAVGAAGNGWAMSNFSLTPSAGTDCVGIEAGGALARANNITCPVNGTYNPQGDVSDRSAHVCVRCGGQFVLSLETPGELNLDYVYMSPGEWGRFAGLPVLAEGVKWLQGMGTSLFRMGGSFCVGNNYFWKRWRGLPWTRPSAAAAWGHDFEGGWGPFEMVDMANAMGVEAVITTFAVGDVQVPSTTTGGRATTRPITPADLADLVEYSFGDATTQWGRMRIEQDQHPAIYNWSYIELGNEQYNPTFVDQVAAMEARAKTVGVEGKLHYLFPSGWNAVPQGVNASDAPRAAALKLGDRLLCDLHVTYGYPHGVLAPNVKGPQSLSQVGGVARFQEVLSSPTTGPQGWGAMNLETNCGDHTHQRALEEAFDLNTYANEGNPRLKGRGASFCMERSGYQEAGLNDQGLIFFLPNVTWGQPPYYTHKMIADTYQPNAVSVTMAGSGIAGGPSPKGVVSAQVSDDGGTLVVRYVNTRPDAITLQVNVNGEAAANSGSMWLLHSDSLTDSNTPSEPTYVSPVMSKVSDISKGVTVPGNSFVIVELKSSS